MKLIEYLKARNESVPEFAARAGLKPRTVANVASGAVNCRIDIAVKIVRAAAERPTKRGGVVRFEELST